MQKPRATVLLPTAAQTNSETGAVTGMSPTSALDSLAVAAAWELGDHHEGSEATRSKDATTSQNQKEAKEAMKDSGNTNNVNPPGMIMVANSIPMQQQQQSQQQQSQQHGRDSEYQQGGEYVYDDDGGDDQEYEEGDEDDEGYNPYHDGRSGRGAGRRGGNMGRGGGPMGRGGMGGNPGNPGNPMAMSQAPMKPRELNPETGADEAGIMYAQSSGRPELETCPPDVFEADLVGFLTARGERQLAAHVREKRITCNSLPLDIYGLYKEVVRRGGYIANERYDDKGSRWTGTINFAGDIFPRLKNWTANNRATSVGSQLLNNYRKFLLAYERAYARWDLPQTELAIQQRQAAHAAGPNPQAQAAAIVAAAMAANRKQQAAWEEMPAMAPQGMAPSAAMAQHRRSNTGILPPPGVKRVTPSQSEAMGWQAPGGGDMMMDDDGMNGHMGRGAGWVNDRMGGGDMNKRRRQTISQDGTPGGMGGMLPPLPMSMQPMGSPAMLRRVEQMQRQWGAAQMQLWNTGQHSPMPGTLLLCADPMYPGLQWAVLVADLGELPIEVADGGRLPAIPTQQAPRLPLRLMEVSQTGRLEDATPVALLGTNAMGWVQRMSCRAPSPDAVQSAMMAAWQRIAAGNPGNTDAEQTCVKGLKMALELLNSTPQPPPAAIGPYHNPPLLAARPLTQAAGVSHTAQKLLDLEGALCPTALTATSPAYWSTWRTQVKNADSPATLCGCVLALLYQISCSYFTMPFKALCYELFPLMGMTPPPTSPAGMVEPDRPLLVTGGAGEATCLGVDMAVGLLRNNIDWPGMQRSWGMMLNAAAPAMPGATTPMATMNMATPVGWVPAGMPATTPPGMAPNSTPLGTMPGPISVVDRSGNAPRPGDPLAQNRRPLPPVGPTAPQPAGPVGAGFSQRPAGGSAPGAAAGLPPRPPAPVKVGGSGPGTGGPSSPTAAGEPGSVQLIQGGTNPNVSPLRVVATDANTRQDVKDEGTGTGAQGGAAAAAAMGSRPGSPTAAATSNTHNTATGSEAHAEGGAAEAAQQPDQAAAGAASDMAVELKQEPAAAAAEQAGTGATQSARLAGVTSGELSRKASVTSQPGNSVAAQGSAGDQGKTQADQAGDHNTAAAGTGTDAGNDKHHPKLTVSPLDLSAPGNNTSTPYNPSPSGLFGGMMGMPGGMMMGGFGGFSPLTSPSSAMVGLPSVQPLVVRDPNAAGGEGGAGPGAGQQGPGGVGMQGSWGSSGGLDSLMMPQQQFPGMQMAPMHMSMAPMYGMVPPGGISGYGMGPPGQAMLQINGNPMMMRMPPHNMQQQNMNR